MAAKPQHILQVRSNSLVYYKQFPNNVLATVGRQKVRDNLRNQKTYTGMLCPGAKKRLVRCVENFVSIMKEKWVWNPITDRMQPFRGAFITLTVYSTDRNIDGAEAHKTLLQPLLQWMRRQHGCTAYIWKAEYQRRGQIHYHITADCFIHYKELRDKWNDLQRQHGYLDSYFKKYGRWNPKNSTQITARKKYVKNFAAYLLKEFTKSYQNDKSINAKVWDCSLNVKRADYFKCNQQHYEPKLNEWVKAGDLSVVETDHCKVYKSFNRPACEILGWQDKLFYDAHINNIIDREWITERRQKKVDNVEIRPAPDIAKQLSFMYN